MDKTCTMAGKSIRELVNGIKVHLAELGYSSSTIARMDAEWQKLIAYADAHDTKVFTMELARAFVWDRCGSVLGDRCTAHTINRTIHMLADFEQYGMVFKQSSIIRKGFSAEYKMLFEGHLEHLHKTGATEGSVRTWRSRLFRFEYFLQNSGVTEFSQIEVKHLYAYVESLTGFSSGTIGATIRLLRRLFDYAIQQNCHHKNFMETLPDVRLQKRYRLPTVLTVDEVEKILNTVDRDNAIGKRNYAILMLVTKLGLRISDVRGLRFDNINWQNKTISIIQKKTSLPLDLPLLDDIGWAIIDYLQYGRPQTDCPCIFVRHLAPYDDLEGSLHRLVLKYLQQAGIKTAPHKPVGMHSFRHSLATTMLKNGARYTDIAQVLGHASPESAQAYISLDEDQLRQCALEVNF